MAEKKLKRQRKSTRTTQKKAKPKASSSIARTKPKVKTSSKAKAKTKAKAKAKTKAKAKAKTTTNTKTKAKTKAKAKTKIKVKTGSKMTAQTQVKGRPRVASSLKTKSGNQAKTKASNKKNRITKDESKAASISMSVSPKRKAVGTKQKITTNDIKTSPKVSVDSDSHQSTRAYTPKKNEEYMGESQKEYFRNILNAWKFELMEEVDRTVSHMKEEAANYPDPADRASQEEEFSLELKTRDRERRLIRKIDKTIDLVDQDDYGYCESCGVEIGIRRLEARPTATQCIDCKTLSEIKERQING